MNTLKDLLFLFISKLLLYTSAALLDVTFVHAYLGYEGVHDWLYMVYIPLFMYWALGVLVAIAVNLVSIFIKRKRKNVRHMQWIAFDFAVLILVLAVLRINELYLPSISDPVSILANIFILLGILLIGYGIWMLSRLKLANWIIPLILLIAFTLFHRFLPYELYKRPAYNTHDKSVLLVTLDTVRADHLGIYGYERDTSPNFDKFAEENHYFTNVRTTMPLTSPSHASIFSGIYPHELGVLTNIAPYPDTEWFLPVAEVYEHFEGYWTAGFPAAVHMGKKFNFDRGFQTYNQSTVLSGPEWLQNVRQFAPAALLSRLGFIRETFLARNSRQVNKAFFNWLDNSHPTKVAFFAWLHYFDAHSPYQPPEEYWRRYDPDYTGSITGSQAELDEINAHAETWLETGSLPDGYSEKDMENLIARYNGEIRFQDESLGQLFDGLKQRGLWEDLIVVIVSDHGEGMFDDGYFGHNFTLREYEIRLALAIKGPNIHCPSDRSMFPGDITHYMENYKAESMGPTDPLLPENAYEFWGGPLCHGYPQNPQYDPQVSMVFLKSHCMIEYPYKLIRRYSEAGQGVEYLLYNLVDDPDEQTDIYDPSDPISNHLRNRLQEWLVKNNADFPDLLKQKQNIQTLDSATREKLRSLGYIY